MRKYLLKLLLFAVCLIVCVSGAILLLEKITDSRRAASLASSDVFIWGDSDIFRGLDFNMLSDSLGGRVASSAYDGAGPYDFLVFAEEVPDSSTCIVAFTEGFMMKEMKHDANRSGVSLNQVWKLARLGWDAKCLYGILKDNRFRPQLNFGYVHEQHPDSETLETSGALDNWVSFYQNEDPYVLKKFSAFKMGVDVLASKGCKIIFLSTPVFPELEYRICNSLNRQRMNELRDEYCERFNAVRHDISLSSNKLLMNDYFHLNQTGAAMMTQKILDENVFDGRNHFLRFTINK